VALSGDGPSLALADARRRRLLGWGMSAAVGGFVFGYQLAVISGALLFIRRELGLSSFEQGLLVSILPLGAMAGGLVAGRLADALGRRRALAAEAVVFVVSIGLAAIAPGFGVLLVARGLSGLAVGAVSSTVPLYLSEIAPPEVRGRMVTINQIMLTSGVLAAYLVDLIFSGSGSWRAMFAVGLLPAAVLLAGMLRAPETPVWLEARGEDESARAVVRQIADEEAAGRMLEDIRRARAALSRQIGVGQLLRSAAPALVIGVTLAAVQQLSGVNVVVYYAPSIMQKTGLSASNSILYSVAIGVVNVVFTIVAIRLVDRLGRRRLLLMSLTGSLVSLVLLGLALEVPLGSADSWLALLCLLGFIAAFAIGLGPVFWLLITEIFPPDARAAGAGVSTATTWFTNFLVSLVFLPVANAIGQGPTFWIFAAVCAFAIVFVNRFVPETKARSVTEIDVEVQARWSGAQAKASRPPGGS
jgi:sugar porter (SP) family MFS transporter